MSAGAIGLRIFLAALTGTVPLLAARAADAIPADFIGRWSADADCAGAVIIEVEADAIALKTPEGAQSYPISDVCETCAGGSAYADPLSCAGASEYTGIEVQVSAGRTGNPALLLRFNARERAGDLLVKVGEQTLAARPLIEGRTFRRCATGQ